MGSMHKMAIRRVFLAAFVALFVQITLLPATLSTASGKSSTAGAKPEFAAFVMEESSGYVLHNRHADKRLHPASLTKIMTLYMLFEAVELKRLKLTSKLKVSKFAASQPPTKLGLRAGSTITVEQAILALVTRSANDVAVVAAEAIGKSERNFARIMTQKARVMGMLRSTFFNASGLSHEHQFTTARDMARLTKILRLRFPAYFQYFSRRSFTYGGQTIGNHNNLLGGFRGTDGVKTGYTRAAGYNLVASVERDGIRLIGVVLGGKSTATRDAHMRKILTNAYAAVNKVPKSKLRVAQSFFRVTKPRVRFVGVPAPRIRPGTAGAVQQTQVARAPVLLEDASNDWAVQLGAFKRYTSAQRALAQAAGILGAGNSAYNSTIDNKTVANGASLYRARFIDLNSNQAREICETLKKRGVRCFRLSPERK